MIIVQISEVGIEQIMMIMMQKLWVEKILRNDKKSHYSTLSPIPVQTPNLYSRIRQLEDEEAESVTAVKKKFFFPGEKQLSQKSICTTVDRRKMREILPKNAVVFYLQANSHQTRPPTPIFTGVNLCLRIFSSEGRWGCRKCDSSAENHFYHRQVI